MEGSVRTTRASKAVCRGQKVLDCATSILAWAVVAGQPWYSVGGWCTRELGWKKKQSRRPQRISLPGWPPRLRSNRQSFSTFRVANPSAPQAPSLYQRGRGVVARATDRLGMLGRGSGLPPGRGPSFLPCRTRPAERAATPPQVTNRAAACSCRFVWVPNLSSPLAQRYTVWSGLIGMYVELPDSILYTSSCSLFLDTNQTTNALRTLSSFLSASSNSNSHHCNQLSPSSFIPSFPLPPCPSPP